jgi:iron complex outermembrane recepter protein
MKYIPIKCAVLFFLALETAWAQAPENTTTAKEGEINSQPLKETEPQDGAPKTDALPTVPAQPEKNSTVAIESVAEEKRLPDVVVTASREEENRFDVPLSIGKIRREGVKDAKPVHPSEIMNQVPGVFVNTTSGEGHATMIRHPITTGSVYLYLEDGVPTRSPGFYNHNALFEINVPQSGGIEIIKGPGSALYGSDAIGGVVNVLTRPVTRDRELDLSVEYGGFGWKRVLASAAEKGENNSIRVDANMTDSKGWRDNTKYSRQSGTLRWDFVSGHHKFKTVVTASNIDQQSAGAASLRQSDFDNNPQANYMPFSYRRVKAVRISTQYDYEISKGQKISTILYGRYNEMGQLPNYLGAGTTQRENNLRNASVGMLFKHHLDIHALKSKIISGVDLDYSPGVFNEWSVTAVKSGDYFTSYTTGALQYDYDVKFYQASPFAQIESSPFTPKLKFQAGARYDYMGYIYSNNLSVLQTGSTRRPADASPSFDNISPKFGVVYDWDEALNIFASYRHGFRVPQQSDLFRQGSANSALGIKPIQVDSVEIGVRGAAFRERLQYELTGFYAEKKDDILSVTISPGVTESQNAGGTTHKGIEFGLEAEILKKLLWFTGNMTYAEHKYVSWSPTSTLTFDGNFQAQAPTVFSTIGLRIIPISGLQISPEWVYLGHYFMDDLNSTVYPGHNFFNLRAKYDVNQRMGIFVRMHNITNVRYSDFSSYNSVSAGTYPSYVPGEPFSIIGGLSYRL